MENNYEIDLNELLSARTTDYRLNEYVKQELYNGVWYDTVYACDSTSTFDQPWLGDGHWDVITSKKVPTYFYISASKADIVRYFTDTSFREGVRRVYELNPEEVEEE